MKKSVVFILVFLLITLGAGCAKETGTMSGDETASASPSQSLTPSAEPSHGVSGAVPPSPSAEAPEAADGESARPSKEPSAPPSDDASETPAETANEEPAETESEETSGNPQDTAGVDDTDYFAMGESLVETESIGPVRLWMSESELLDAVGQPDSQSEPEVWGADGSMHSVWSYVTLGLYLDMLQYDESSAPVVFSITADDSCDYETQQGIRIGDTRDDVMAVYADVYNPYESEEDLLVLGSIFCGMLVTLENDVVTGFYVGAIAE
jgi:hypothetical protein